MSTNDLEWFKRNSKYFHVRYIEMELGFPAGTIQKWIKGERNLNLERINAMDVFIGKLRGFVISTEDLIIKESVVDPSEVVERFTKEIASKTESNKSPGCDIVGSFQQSSSVISEDGKSVLSCGHEYKDFDEILDVIKKGKVVKPKKVKEPKLTPEVKEKLSDGLNKIIENKNKVDVPIDMTTVDVVTGEIKEKLVAIRPIWLFKRVESTYEVVEPWISKSGNLYEVKRMFANTPRYVYVNNLEDARRLAHTKNPLLVELSIQ